MSELSPTPSEVPDRQPLDAFGAQLDDASVNNEVYKADNKDVSASAGNVIPGAPEAYIDDASIDYQMPPQDFEETVQPSGTTKEADFDIDYAVNLFTNGASKEELEALGVDPAKVEAYVKSRPNDEYEFLIEKRKESLYTMEAKTKLQSAEPELFTGRIRPDLEAKITEAGYDRYAVGFVQLDAIQTLEAAKQLLADNGGIDMGGYNPNQRFLLHDSESPADDYPMGYYSARIGRFVYAMPVESSVGDAPRQAVALQEGVPDDLLVIGANGDEVANSKYCAGFIDEEQIFYANPRFMKDPKPAAQQAEQSQEQKKSNPYERFSDEEAIQIRDNIAHSFVEGIRKFDKDEVARASVNLMVVQRELEARSLVPAPKYPRGTTIGEVLYVTNLDPGMVQSIADQIRAIDGGKGVAARMYSGLETPSKDDQEAYWQGAELHGLLWAITRQFRGEFGTIDDPKNPYANWSNEELDKTMARFKQTISELSATGGDTVEVRERLRLVGQVIQSRKS